MSFKLTPKEVPEFFTYKKVVESFVEQDTKSALMSRQDVLPASLYIGLRKAAKKYFPNKVVVYKRGNDIFLAKVGELESKK